MSPNDIDPAELVSDFATLEIIATAINTRIDEQTSIALGRAHHNV